MSTSTPTTSASTTRAPRLPLDLGAIRQQAFDIESQVGDIEILIASVFDKVDDMLAHAPAPATMEAINAINCFATCALRNAALIKEAGASILTLTAEGGEK